MATQADVRRIALALPGAVEAKGRFAFEVPLYDKRSKAMKMKGFAWVWMERIHPKKARVPQPKVIAIRTASPLIEEAWRCMASQELQEGRQD